MQFENENNRLEKIKNNIYCFIKIKASLIYLSYEAYDDVFLFAIFLDIDDCVNVTCHNNGSCDDGVNSYLCLCQKGFTGKHCKTSK